MQINIETAEEIVSYGFSKKHLLTQKKLLCQLISTVHQKRALIQRYLATVHIISAQFQRKQLSLQQLMTHLHHREQTLDQGLIKITQQQKELEHQQYRIQADLTLVRQKLSTTCAKKQLCERHYHAVASIPFLSSHFKKRYIKARDKSYLVEQEVSEIRSSLEKCQHHAKLVAKTIAEQSKEQSMASVRRRGSADRIEAATQQLAYLAQGCEFWNGFDEFQAAVVLESAVYLHGLDSSVNGFSTAPVATEVTAGPRRKRKERATAGPMLDMNEIWTKTFKLACFEYEDREAYGDARWGPESLRISFECDLCQTAQEGWPRVVNKDELACELCFNAIQANQQESSVKETDVGSRKSSDVGLVGAVTAVVRETKKSTVTAFDKNGSIEVVLPNTKKFKRIINNMFGLNNHTKVSPLLA